MQKVFVGLSGGVDSAVSAALLKKEGFDVTGVFIKIWSPEFLECTWREDRLDAMRVAVALDIPFREIDLSDKYRDLVVSDMIEQYQKGRTPNPDVLCNEFIKFGAFADWAFKNGADLIATGHYARVQKENGHAKLLKGIDPKKDQSYFLYRLSEKVLMKTLFPVGGFTKAEIREMAENFKLPNAKRPDSQGLCFVGDISMNEFLSRFITLNKGSLIDEEGQVIGEHDGAALYTIGQRHGFHLNTGAGSGPYYVTRIDSEKNTVQVSKKRSETEHTKARLTDMHWIGTTEKFIEGTPRYHAKPQKAEIADDTAVFESPLQLTPGQSLVFYSGDMCLGGAIIHSSRE
jgi:tRNA-specific 2-thiouridylase